MIKAKPLEQIRVLVTRPLLQAPALCDVFSVLGARTMCLPAIEIRATEPAEDDRSSKQVCADWIKHLDDFDFMIFISANAVRYGTALILAHKNIPDKLKLVTIGKASADKLFQCTGRSADIFPLHEFSSETLLALKPVQTEFVSGKNILIIRGNGGREYLAQQLRQRGAKVEYAEVYQRFRPKPDEKTLAGIWRVDPPHIVTITSAEGLKNLLQLVGERYQAVLRNTPLVVVTRNMLQLARDMGFTNDIIVAAKSSNQSLVEGVMQWQTNRTKT